MDIFELKQQYQKITSLFNTLITEDYQAKLDQQLDKLSKEMNDPNFYSNNKNVKSKVATFKSQTYIKNMIGEITNNLKDVEEYLEYLSQNEDDKLYNDIKHLLDDTLDKYQELEKYILLDEEYDPLDAFLEIHSGAGGVESQDWVEMLYQMYIAFCKKHNFKIELIDAMKMPEAGYKNIMIKISGDYAYGLLKNETGVHRLIRISPFDSGARRHTSFASVSVSPVIENDESITINDSDLEIDTYRSSGAGGQSVNTTDSAVRVLHKPSGIVVTCQNQRSQLQNKQEALRVLQAKLIAQKIKENKEQAQALKGQTSDVNFGSQIRTYVFHPYAMVKDHRSNFEASNPNKVLAGELDEIINSILRLKKEGEIND